MSNEHSADHHKKLARHHATENRHSEAVQVLSDAVDAGSGDAETFALAAKSLLVLGRRQDALVASERAIILDPFLVTAVEARVRTLLEMASIESDQKRQLIRSARQTLSPFLQQGTHEAIAQTLLSEIEGLDNNKQESLLAARKAVELAPDSAEAHHALAMATDEQLSFEAKRHFVKAAELAPDNELYQYNASLREGPLKRVDRMAELASKNPSSSFPARGLAVVLFVFLYISVKIYGSIVREAVWQVQLGYWLIALVLLSFLLRRAGLRLWRQAFGSVVPLVVNMAVGIAGLLMFAIGFAGSGDVHRLPLFIWLPLCVAGVVTVVTAVLVWKVPVKK